MSIEITEEEISAETERIRAEYPTALKWLSANELRGGAIRILYEQKWSQLQNEIFSYKKIDTSTKDE